MRDGAPALLVLGHPGIVASGFPESGVLVAIVRFPFDEEFLSCLRRILSFHVSYKSGIAALLDEFCCSRWRDDRQ